MLLATTVCYSQVKVKYFDVNNELIKKSKYDMSVAYKVNAGTIDEIVVDGESSYTNTYIITHITHSPVGDEYEWSEYTCTGNTFESIKFSFYANQRRSVLIEYLNNKYTIISGIKKITS